MSYIFERKTVFDHISIHLIFNHAEWFGKFENFANEFSDHVHES